jgi:hypothetical protein
VNGLFPPITVRPDPDLPGFATPRRPDVWKPGYYAAYMTARAAPVHAETRANDVYDRYYWGEQSDSEEALTFQALAWLTRLAVASGLDAQILWHEGGI